MLAAPLPVQDVRIASGQLSARLLDFGASLVDLRLAGVPHPFVLGLEQGEDYPGHGLLFGAVIGRNANRIGAARARIGEDIVQLQANEGKNQLHGGAAGFATRSWSIGEVTADSVSFELDSADGEGGFPGSVRASATYSIVAPATLCLTFSAVTDQPTIVNLCHHPYFNLDGAGAIDRHRLEIHAGDYLPATADLLPTGEIAAVADTPFDFRQPTPIAEMCLRGGAQYNNTFCLASEPRKEPEFAARLEGTSGTVMELWTTQTGLHLYDGYKIGDRPGGLDGRRYGPRDGLCLEAQNWPDSPNHPAFPTAVLTPGHTYHQRTEYRFTHQGVSG